MTPMRSSRIAFAGAALAGSLLVALLLPAHAWSQFTFKSSTSTQTTAASQAKVELVALASSSRTIAGPGNFTDDTTNPEQNVIYEVFGGAAVDVCLTIQNRGQLGDVRTIVDGVETGDRIKPRRTRARCFTAPSTIELGCTSSLCNALWRIDATS